MKLSELRKQMSVHAAFTGKKDVIPDSVKAYMKEKNIDLAHLYQEIEMDSLYINTHQDKSVFVMGLHSHIFYEILYIRRGSIQYFLGTDRYQIQPGDILFIPPKVSHQALLTDHSSEPYERYVLWLSQEYVDRLRIIWPGLRLNNDQCRLLRIPADSWEHISQAFQYGVSKSEEGRPGWELEVLGNTTQLLVQLERLFADTGAVSPAKEQRELLDDIVEYIEHHLAEKITLERIARHFLVSRSTVSHIFQQRMDVSFYRFVTQRRLIAARNLILSGETMNSIAEKLGFSDYSSFYRAFRQEYGISPRDYAKLCAERKAR